MLRRCGSIGIVLLSIGFLDSVANADTMSTWNGGSGNWSTAGQWTPPQVPNNNTQSYNVTISNGTATLDISPTINSFTLNGGLAYGYDISTGYSTTLTVNRNATVNGSIASNDPYVGWQDSLIIGGNLTNAGYINPGNQLSVSGNVHNSGTLLVLPSGGTTGFNTGGSVVNTGTLQWGSRDGASSGGNSSLGGIVNTGSVFIGSGSNVSVASGVTDIPKGASWFIALVYRRTIQRVR